MGNGELGTPLQRHVKLNRRITSTRIGGFTVACLEKCISHCDFCL